MLALPAALAVCELAVRFGLAGPAPRPSIECSLIEPVSVGELRFVNRPHATRTTTIRDARCSPPRTVVQRTNGQRLRGREVAVPKPAGTLRIACVGDSHTFGDGVRDDETWPAHLERELRRRLPGVHVEVLNAGVNGYDTEQELDWIRHHVLSFEPDIVVLQFFLNDIGRRSDRPGEASTAWTRITHPRRGGAIGTVRSHSALVDALAETIYRRHHLGEYADALDELYADDHPAWRATTTSIEAIVRLVRSHGIALGVALYPMMVATDGDLASGPGLRKVAAHLARVGVPCLDAGEVFRTRDVTTLRIAPGDIHAGAEAHAVFAEAVAASFTDLWKERAPRRDPAPASAFADARP